MVRGDDHRPVLGDVLAPDSVLAKPDQEEGDEQQAHDPQDEAVDSALPGPVEQLLSCPCLRYRLGARGLHATRSRIARNGH